MTQRVITVPIVNQGANDLLPFTFSAESGYVANNSTLNFTIEVASSNYLDYQAILNRDNSAVLSNVNSQATYVPIKDEARYTHQSSFYVDIIGKDVGGIKDIRTHVEPFAYDFETVSEDDIVFCIPKFTWENSWDQSSTTTTTTLFSDKTMWIGTSNNQLEHIRYNNESSSIITTEDLSYPVYKIMFGQDNDSMYVSTSNYIYKYTVGYYDSQITDVKQWVKITNPNRIIMSLYNDSFVWGVEAYSNKVVKLNPDTLVLVKEYTGIDAPFKVVYSEFHDAYFVAGSYMVWKIDDNTSTTTLIYSANDYRVVDIDVSENGQLCILLNGISDGYIKVLNSNIYNLLLDQKITPSVLKYCSYTKAGKFYILSELNIGTGETIYSAIHWIFDTNTKTLSQFDSEEILQTTTTTTLPGTTLNAVQIVSPNGGESLEWGEKVDIRWISSKSINDTVKIELYKAGGLYSSIVESTANSGVYTWTVSSQISEDTDYRIKISWISASSNSGNTSTSASDFAIMSVVPVITTTTTTLITQESVGISYDELNNQVIIIIRGGSYIVFDLGENAVYGLNNLGVVNPFCVGIKNTRIEELDKQSRFRLFVGSEEGLSDKWDSGEVISELNSCWFGGGNVLEPGQEYHLGLQVYSEKLGWSSVQSAIFTMPK